MPKVTIQNVRCPVCGAYYGVRSDQPMDRCRIPKCKAKVQLEKVNAIPRQHPAQYGKPMQKPDPFNNTPPNSRARWRRRRKPESYDPPRGKTQSTPVEVGEVRGPDPVLLQPNPDAIHVEYHNVAPPIAAPVAKGGLSFGMLIFIALMTLLFVGIIYMANSVWGDGGGLGGLGGSDICAKMQSSIEEVGSCSGQGTCQDGWSYCETKGIGQPWGHGCVPNVCR